MAPIGFRLGENVFLTIPNVSFFDVKKMFSDKIFGSIIQFFVDFVGFWRSKSETDLAINFYVKFCFRTTDPEVCTIENH